MYLKRLKVRNFKSFSGAIEIPFQPGFTGIAGPNGMGKSNISDAILFVLGPTSSKALRADRLTHLFFNGGSSKKPATECEVSLIFDNRDRLLPSEREEVEVTRYVKLAPGAADGYYSYFYINGRRSTQGEIDSLLSHARLSGDGYNLVQQGDVNKIVSMGTVPRRGLVERLAGISQYDDELARASTKRESLEANLTQINTLLTEIRSHLQGLESQRLSAIQYKELLEQKRKAEARLAHADLAMARHEAEQCERARTKLGAEIHELEQKVTQLEAERDRLANEITRIEQEAAARRGPEGQKFQKELEDRRMALARAEDAATRADEALEQLGTRIADLGAEVKATQTTVDSLTQKVGKLSFEATRSEKANEAAAAAFRDATGTAEKTPGKLSNTRQQIQTQQKLEAARTDEWQLAIQARESAKASLESAEAEVAKGEDDERDRGLELKDLEMRVKQARGGGPKGSRATPEMVQELAKLRARERASSEESKSLEAEVFELNRRYMALDARLKARADSGSRVGSMAAVEYLLSLRNLGKVEGIRGTVEELARFDSQYHTALTIAGGNRFHSLVVETDQVAEECIKLLRTEKRGRATFLPLNRMLAGRPKGKSLVVAQGAGAVGFAIDLVKFDEPLRPAFWYVFGETVLMKDLASAREQMGGVRLVTLGGELIEATGAITGGFVEIGDKARGGDSAVELRRVGDELREKNALAAAAKSDLVRLTEEIRALSEELAKRTGEAQAQGETSKVLDQELIGARARLHETVERLGKARAAHAAAEKALAAGEKDAARIEGELAQIKQALATLNGEYSQQLPDSIAARIRSLQEASEQAVKAHVTLASELGATRGELKAAEATLAEKRANLTAAEEARGTQTKELARLQKAVETAREEREKYGALEAEQLKAIEREAAAKKKLEDQRIALVGQLGTSQEALRQRRQMAQNEEVRGAQAQKKLGEMEEAAKAYPDLASDESPVPADELRRAIQTLTGQMDAMGSVNLRALEEYDAEKTRLDEFEGEVTRVTTERTELQGLVGEIEKKKRTKLIEVVTAVNDLYRQIYAELSGGGEGEIALENAEDPLAGGLLIRAKPIGKTVRGLEQLSGGEKSLASLAFVFALQRYDPSPLYVFDEVDMSLDGINAENVGRMLRRHSERAQFIVISLRKVTLKFAHRLFGVTMHGDGCSRVVGLKIDEIVDVDEQKRTELRSELPAPEAAA
jgi:chromosome segregation protein